MVSPNYDMGQVIRVSIEGTMNINGHVQQYVNVMHWECITGDPTPTQITDLKNIYEDELLPQYMDMYYSSVTNITNLRFRDIVGPFPEEHNFTQALVGTRTLDGDLLPPYSAIVMSLYTPNLGRRFRGRNYFSGFAEADQSGGVWESDMINLVADFQAAFITHIAGPFFSGDWSLGVLSDPFHTLPNPPDPIDSTSPFITPVTVMTPKSTVFTQKKRKFRNLLDIS
jgi:hypothetical protein